jgi:hypothetical protein
MKMAVIWDVAPCFLVDTEQRFRSPYCLHHQGHKTVFILAAVRTWSDMIIDTTADLPFNDAGRDSDFETVLNCFEIYITQGNKQE